MYLQPGEVCQHEVKCPHVKGVGSFCQGTNPRRAGAFSCEYVNQTGQFSESKKGFRNVYDQTGRMEILTEEG